MTQALARAAPERSLADLLDARRYIVVGANSGGDAVARYLRARGKEIAAFADLDPARAGEERLGCRVIDLGSVPQALARDTAVVIGSFKHSQIADRLIHELGVDPLSVFPYVNDMFAVHYEPDYYRRHAGEFAAVRRLLADDESRAYFDRVLAFYRTLDPLLLTPNPKAYGPYGYQAAGVRPKPGAVILDCGAFTGDTCAFYLEETAGQCLIYAVEAYLPNVIRLQDTLTAQGALGRVKALHLALGAQTGPIMLDGDPSMADGGARISALPAEAFAADLVLRETIDRLFESHFPTRLDHIKVDVEGADLEVLSGGEAIIGRDKPVLALASYHTPEHIWRLPLTAASFVGPCRIYAAHDPAWVHHIHYLIVPESRR